MDLVLGLLLKRKKFKFHSLKLIFCSYLALGKSLLIKLRLFVPGSSNGPDLIIFPEHLPLKLGLHKAHLMLIMLFKLKQVSHELINMDFEGAIFLMRAIKFFLGGLTGLNENVDIRLNFVDFVGLESQGLILLGKHVKLTLNRMSLGHGGCWSADGGCNGVEIRFLLINSVNSCFLIHKQNKFFKDRSFS